jgi:hypothetical protein
MPSLSGDCCFTKPGVVHARRPSLVTGVQTCKRPSPEWAAVQSRSNTCVPNSPSSVGCWLPHTITLLAGGYACQAALWCLLTAGRCVYV